MFRPRWSIAAVLVAVLVLSLIGAPALAHPGAGSASAVHLAVARPAAPQDSVIPTDNFGGFTSDYYVGLSAGQVYFTAYDPVDTSARITITDQNATRDGLVNPVYNTTVTLNGAHYNYSYLWNTFYQIPLTLTQGGYWNISVSGTTAGVFSTHFYVHTYSVRLYTDAPTYLPGHVANVTFVVSATVNGAPLGQISSVAAMVTYTDSHGNFISLFGKAGRSLTAAAIGSFSFSIPTNATPYTSVFILVWANQTSTGGTNSETGTTSVTIGTLEAPTFYIGSCETGCYTTVFPAGAIAFVHLSYLIDSGYGPTAPAVGLHVAFTFHAASALVTAVPGNPPAAAITNSTGGVGFLFVASSSAFSTTKPNTLWYNASDPAFVNTTMNGSATFFVQTVQGSALISLLLNSAQYYSGDTVTGTWAIGGTNATAGTGWQADSWYAFNYQTDGLMAVAAITSTANTGTFQYMLPAGFTGEVTIYVIAHNATETIAAYQNAWVSAPLILLSPSELYYSAGDTITVGITLEGSVLNGAALFGSAVESSGAILWSGPISGTSFPVTVPKVAAPSELLFTVSAQTSSAGVISSARAYSYEAIGYVVTGGVTTASTYTDGSYQPGETVTVQYTITAVGPVVFGKAFHIYLYPNAWGNSESASSFSTTSMSGTFSYTIPSGLPSGSQLFEIEAISSACSYYYCYAYTAFSLFINSAPPALGYELGAGTGLTVGWLILLVLILVVALLTWRAMRGRRRPMMMSPTSATGSSSGAGGTPGWQESSSAGGSSPPPAGTPSSGSPPLPTPPSGGSS